jgi:DNA-binding HxlR family transcriptional regulator
LWRDHVRQGRVNTGDVELVPPVPPPQRHPYDQWAPDARALDLVGDKWTLLIIRDLADDSLRFCELERSLEGISPRTLSLRLRALEEQGVVERFTYPEVPPRVEYTLTDKGRALVPLIEDMRSYGRRWLPRGRAEKPVGAAA